jgi:prevent-host-death family protein
MRDTYPLYEAKAKLSQLVRQVREGRTITITVRGEPVAALAPATGTAARTIEDRLAELEARGELAPARGGRGSLRPVARRPGALKRFLDSRD